MSYKLNGKVITEGRIVHYVFTKEVHRPAMIVNVWDGVTVYHPEGRVNLNVFTDFSNDSAYDPSATNGQCWRTSVRYSELGEPNTWHWPETDVEAT